LNDRFQYDLARVTVLRWFGIHPDGTGNRWSAKDGALFLAAVLAPLAVAGLHQAFWHPSAQGRGAYFFWLGYYVGIDLITVLAQWIGCRAFHRTLPSVDRMLTPAGTWAVHAWIDRGMRPWRQQRWMLVGGAFCCATVWALSTSRQVDDHMYIDAASYLTVAMTGAACANSLFWVLRAARLARIVTKPGNLRLVWSAPARTPGIEALSRWHRVVTVVLVGGAAVAFAPWVWLAPYVAHEGVYLATKWVVASLIIAAIILFGFYPQWRLSQAVMAKRTAVLHVLSHRLPRNLPGGRALTDDEAKDIDLYEKVSQSPAGVIDAQTVAATLLSVATVLVPLAVAALAR
jgi:hypothetical protein